MPSLTIETGLGTKYVAPGVTISIADRLAESDFEGVPFLRLDRLRIAAAPEVDACQMHYEYGHLSREGELSKDHHQPLDLAGKFVKVEIEATVEGDEPILWYGVIEADEKHARGSDGENPSGTQFVTAFGLLRLIEKRIIKSSWVDDGTGTDVIKINTGLQFNYDGGGQFPVIANAAESDVLGTAVFSSSPRSQREWNAFEAVKYILKYHAPKEDDDVTDANQWEFEDESAAAGILNWYKITVRCELRTVKEVIDELIDRRRGVSYFAYFDNANDTVKIKPFSFAPSDITLPSGITLSANPDQRTLDFETALDVQEAVISNVATTRYNRVRVYGEFMTSTFTQWIGNATNPMLVSDWSAGDETKYFDGATNLPTGAPDPEYAAADFLTQCRWNALARSCDKFRHVFRRYKVSGDWDGKTFSWHDGAGTSYWALPVIPEDGSDIDGTTETGTSETTWYRGLHILRHLPLLDRCDYSDDNIETGDWETVAFDDLPEYVPLLAYACTDGAASGLVRDLEGAYVENGPRFEQLERLNYSSFDEIGGFKWGAHVHVDQVKPAIELCAHPSQMLAKDIWAAATVASTDDSHDPTKMHGVNPDDLFVTMTAAYQKRVQRTIEIVAPETGAPAAELIIHAPGMRCDWVAPYTTVGIVSGRPVVTTTGGTVRDDRKKISDIARCAAEWYGDERKTLSLTYKQARNLFELGWLITDIGPNYADGPQAIRTPITAIDYVFPNANIGPTTRIETSFAEMDVR